MIDANQCPLLTIRTAYESRLRGGLVYNLFTPSIQITATQLNLCFCTSHHCLGVRLLECMIKKLIVIKIWWKSQNRLTSFTPTFFDDGYITSQRSRTLQRTSRLSVILCEGCATSLTMPIRCQQLGRGWAANELNQIEGWGCQESCRFPCISGWAFILRSGLLSQRVPWKLGASCKCGPHDPVLGNHPTTILPLLLFFLVQEEEAFLSLLLIDCS